MVKVFLILINFVVAANAVASQDLIKKAQGLVLQRDRSQAMQILVKAIKAQPSRSAELMPALDEVSTVFYTEKTQKFFEYAKSLFLESTQEAMDKLQEAAKLEPNNTEISLWISRLYLKQGRCEDALQNILKSLERNPYYQASQLVKIQSLVCLQKEDDLKKSTAELKKIETAYPIYYQVLMSQEALNLGDYASAENHLQRAEQLDKTFPEIYFWKTQVLEKQEKDIKESATKYVKNCKAMTKKDFTRYEFEPRTCVEYKNFEAEHKSILDQESKKDL